MSPATTNPMISIWLPGPDTACAEKFTIRLEAITLRACCPESDLALSTTLDTRTGAKPIQLSVSHGLAIPVRSAAACIPALESGIRARVNPSRVMPRNPRIVVLAPYLAPELAQRFARMPQLSNRLKKASCKSRVPLTLDSETSIFLVPTRGAKA